MSAKAQSNVYSVNIVGYAQIRVGGGNDIYANVFDLDGINNADKILNHAALSDTGGNPGLDQFYVNTYNGVSFNSVYFEQDFTSPNTGGAVTNGWATDALVAERRLSRRICRRARAFSLTTAVLL